jgi:diaminohydroxyphosphoribosylaminopyrimidine deaminase/5-amino-6-(5-phosphoribosylamino)uracil reductase
MNNHEYFMREALAEAERADYSLSPNPKVGCVIVKNNEIISRGYHRGRGQPHAEVEAINQISHITQGADLYVTLEPCCHTGKTPPCTEAIIKAGIRRVFFSILDPNPLVAGQGVQKLREAGIEVFQGFCEVEARQLNRFFIHFMTIGSPYVIGKWAMSLDGKMTINDGDERQISSAESQQHLHRTRNNVDAILVGVNTIIQDDPLLTARYSAANIIHHPLRIVLDTRGRSPLNAKVLDGKLPGKTLIATTELADPAWRESIQNAELLILPINNNRVDLKSLLALLAKRQIMSVLVEGGRTVLQDFFAQDLVQETQVYFASKFIGDLRQKKDLVLQAEEALGEDRFFSFTF